MKKPKDITDLANRLSNAASTPLVAPQSTASIEDAQPTENSRRHKGPNRSTVPVFLRLSQTLYEQCDQEAMRQTKETGRGVTVQQVILARLEGTTV